MDFGQLLHVAKKNSEQSKNSAGKCYSTKFSAPKKVSKEKTLSDNIKKFLVKKEQEEREKARQEKAKLDNLLSQRDEKSKNKIRKMLKVTKSANKSVLDDAIDNQHTSVTMQGPDQPDEDDYGYVSNEAAAFFQKYVDKVGKLPEDKFAPSRPQSKNDLRGTKDRVKAAILREQDEKNGITRTKTSTSSTSSTTNSSKISSTSRKDLYDPDGEADEKRKREEEQRKLKIKKSGGPPPPILDFKELLKLAEKKQFEPIAIKKVELEKEPERLLTKKEKLEMEQRKAFLEDRQKRASNNVQKMQPNGKIPKLNSGQTSKDSMNSGQTSKDSFKKPAIPQKNLSTSIAKSKSIAVTNGSQQPNDLKNKIISQQKPSTSVNSIKLPSTAGGVTGQQQKKISTIGHTSNNNNKISTTSNGKSNYNGPTREFPPKDIKRVPSQQNIKTREFPPKDLQKTRQFPPPDVRRSRPEYDRKPMKRRIYDDYDDDEDEYDSELDDFIEDDPVGERNVSSYIKEIFGYDKSRYRDCDDDLDNMESNFAQQMREETISKKIGLMEDLEDMKKEAEEKKKKNIMKKKKIK